VYASHYKEARMHLSLGKGRADRPTYQNDSGGTMFCVRIPLAESPSAQEAAE
jgi:hypothetical protein